MLINNIQYKNSMLLRSFQCWETVLGDKEKSTKGVYFQLLYCLLQLVFNSFSSSEDTCMNAFVE